jgi:hypothetical protein
MSIKEKVETTLDAAASYQAQASALLDAARKQLHCEESLDAAANYQQRAAALLATVKRQLDSVSAG